jgi:SAM-dependent methyltransferase
MPAAVRWREQLEAWAIPQELLDAVPDSPYEWPSELWERGRAAAEERRDSVTAAIVRDLLPDGGTVLDVGAGTGRASLPLAREGYRLTAVERDRGMIAGLRRQTAGLGGVAVIEGSWPEAAIEVGRHDVAMCAHVVYDVPDVVPFLVALNAAARRAVIVETTPHHPWQSLAPYYMALHHLDRPRGPTLDDLAVIVEEKLGVAPTRREWTGPGSLRFSSIDELVDYQRRRLVLPLERTSELERLLTADIVRDGEWFLLGPAERPLVTLWWETSR